MRAVAVYTLACSVMACANCTQAMYSTGTMRLAMVAGAAVFAAGAKGGMCAIEVATRPAGRRP